MHVTRNVPAEWGGQNAAEISGTMCSTWAVPNSMKNVVATATVMKNSAALTEPITLRCKCAYHGRCSLEAIIRLTNPAETPTFRINKIRDRVMSILNKPHFQDEEAAFAKLESVVWPNGPVCPHCGARSGSIALKGVRRRPARRPGGIVRHGLKKCGHCRKQFTARVGTVFESSHIPLHKWLQAVHLLCSSKKGISSHQLHRTLEITYKTAWFMSHRIREAMRSGALAPMGGAGSSGVVEADETFIGRKKGEPKRRGGGAHKNAVLALVERGGQVRTVHVENVKAATLAADRPREHRQGGARHDRRRRHLLQQAGRLRWPRHREPQRQGVRAVRRPVSRSTPTPSKATSASSSAA